MSIITLLAAALDAELRARRIAYVLSPHLPISRADCAAIMAAVLDRTVAAGTAGEDVMAKQESAETTGRST